MEGTNNTASIDEVGSRERVEHTADSVIVKLHEPITFVVSNAEGERTVETLTFPRKVKGKHLLATDQAEGEMGKSLALLAKLAGIPRLAAHELDGRDIDLCMEAIEPFLPGHRVMGDR
jgi:hypothetical protein